MKMFLCICDLDGVVADNTERFNRAEEAKRAFMQDKEARLDAILSGGSAGKDKSAEIFWQTAFTPELVALDTLIEGAIDAMAYLAFRGFDVVTLTSRPESMREATRQWLFDRGYPVDEPLIMKAPAFQFVKTVTWKAGMVQTLAALYDAKEVLFIDDEEANRLAVCTSEMADRYNLWCAESLAAAVEALKGEV